MPMDEEICWSVCVCSPLIEVDSVEIDVARFWNAVSAPCWLALDVGDSEAEAKRGEHVAQLRCERAAVARLSQHAVQLVEHAGLRGILRGRGIGRQHFLVQELVCHALDVARR